MKKKWPYLPVLAIILIFTFLPVNFLRAGSGNLVQNGDFAGNSLSSWSSWGDVVMVSESARVSSTTGSNSGNGASIAGGQGSIVGALFGVIFMSLIVNLFNILEISPFWQNVVVGCILIFVIFLDACLNMRRKRTLG